MTTAIEKTEPETRKEVSKDLKSYNSEIARMKKEYLILKLSGPDDKENYKKIVEYSKEAKNLRLDFTKTHKDLKADALKVCNDLDAEKRRLISEISEVEDHLNDQKNIVLEAEKRKKEEEQRLRQEAFDRKVQDVIEAGAVFDGEYYVYGDQRLSNNDIWMFSQEAFSMTLKGINLWKQGEDRKLEEQEADRKREQERQAKIAAEQKAEQDRLDKIAKEQAEEKRKLDEEKKAVEAGKLELMEANTNARIQQLNSLGLLYNRVENGFFFEDVNVYMVEIKTSDAKEWNDLIYKITPVIKDRKNAAAKAVEEAKEKEIKEAEEKAKAEGKKEAEAEEKEAKEKARKEKAASERKARLAPDKDKIYAYANALLSIKTPDLKVSESEKFFDSIHTQIVAQIAKLVEATQPK